MTCVSLVFQGNLPIYMLAHSVSRVSCSSCRYRLEEDETTPVAASLGRTGESMLDESELVWEGTVGSRYPEDEVTYRKFCMHAWYDDECPHCKHAETSKKSLPETISEDTTETTGQYDTVSQAVSPVAGGADPGADPGQHELNRALAREAEPEMKAQSALQQEMETVPVRGTEIVSARGELNENAMTHAAAESGQENLNLSTRLQGGGNDRFNMVSKELIDSPSNGTVHTEPCADLASLCHGDVEKHVLSSVEVWDPFSNEWLDRRRVASDGRWAGKAPVPGLAALREWREIERGAMKCWRLVSARHAFAACALPSGGAFIAGGMDAQGTPLRSAAVLNTTTGNAVALV
eukprot:COSAG01_NODE_825_length_13294_cov_30.659038_12_plen_349_part_00